MGSACAEFSHTLTPGLSGLVPEQAHEGLIGMIPLSLLGTPGDMVRPLCSWRLMTTPTSLASNRSWILAGPRHEDKMHAELDDPGIIADPADEIQ